MGLWIIRDYWSVSLLMSSSPHWPTNAWFPRAMNARVKMATSPCKELQFLRNHLLPYVCCSQNTWSKGVLVIYQEHAKSRTSALYFPEVCVVVPWMSIDFFFYFQNDVSQGNVCFSKESPPLTDTMSCILCTNYMQLLGKNNNSHKAPLYQRQNQHAWCASSVMLCLLNPQHIYPSLAFHPTDSSCCWTVLYAFTGTTSRT